MIAMTRLHADQIDVDVATVARLVAAQFPAWAGLAVRRVPSGGTDNAVYRLGGDLAVRMPLRAATADGVLKEARWVPVLAPYLTLDVPAVVAIGEPGEGCPVPWTVVRWLPGRDALAAPPGPGVGRALAGFVAELHAIDTAGAPPPLSAGFTRGGPLASRDAVFRDYLARCGDLLDVPRVAAVWARALAAPPWDGPPVWLHADLLPANLLVRDGRLAGVLDFGTVCTGDPAYDVTAAWHLPDPAQRRDFLELVGPDEATIARARGLVASFAAIALPYYIDTNPTMVTTARTALAAVLRD
jgi:aminoglycoside phosphotransferase (APT) family kinase protein